MLDLIWGIATLEAYGRRGGVSGYANTRQPSDQLEKTMACTEKLRVLLQSLLGRTRSVSRLISINLENIPGHLRGRSPASASSAAVSRHSRLRKAWLPWRVSRLRNTASGLENDRAWSRCEFRPLPVARPSALSSGKAPAQSVHGSKLSPVVKSALRRSSSALSLLFSR